MSIFGKLILEDVVQVDDKTRLDATKSFVSKDESAVTLVRIEAEDGVSGYVDVTGSSSEDWYLDWAYSGLSRTVTVNVEITTDGSPVVFQQTLSLLTAADDKLFSADNQLTAREPDILNWVRVGRNSFLNIHRRARTIIVEWFNERGVTDIDGNKLDKNDFVDVEEVKLWAINLTLNLIFSGLHDVNEDVFKQKAIDYLKDANDHRDRALIRVDLDNDGVIEDGEINRIQSIGMSR